MTPDAIESDNTPRNASQRHRSRRSRKRRNSADMSKFHDPFLEEENLLLLHGFTTADEDNDEETAKKNVTPLRLVDINDSPRVKITETEKTPEDRVSKTDQEKSDMKQNIDDIDNNRPQTRRRKSRRRSSLTLQRQELLQIIQANMEKNNLYYTSTPQPGGGRTSSNPRNSNNYSHNRSSRKPSHHHHHHHNHRRKRRQHYPHHYIDSPSCCCSNCCCHNCWGSSGGPTGGRTSPCFDSKGSHSSHFPDPATLKAKLLLECDCGGEYGIDTAGINVGHSGRRKKRNFYNHSNHCKGRSRSHDISGDIDTPNYGQSPRGEDDGSYYSPLAPKNTPDKIPCSPRERDIGFNPHQHLHQHHHSHHLRSRSCGATPEHLSQNKNSNLLFILS